MEEAFKEEEKHNLKKAWFGYIRCFSKNSDFIFKHVGKGQRQVCCKACRTKIPKELPRIKVSGSWYYYTGHYCLKCAIEKISGDIEEKSGLAKNLQDNLAELIALLEVASHAASKEKYKDLMAIHVLSRKLEPKKDWEFT